MSFLSHNEKCLFSVIINTWLTQYCLVLETGTLTKTLSNTPQLKLPGLQKSPKRNCIVCGCFADLYCGRCNVTPYCSDQCQRKDWVARHKAVCHNLMRMQTSGKESAALPTEETPSEPVIPAPAPLRRPRSPNNRAQQPPRNQQQGHNKERPARFVPPDHQPQQPVRNQRAPYNKFNNNNNNQDRRPRNIQQNNNDNSKDDEEWGNVPKTPETKPAKKSVEKTPKPSIPPSERKVEEPKHAPSSKLEPKAPEQKPALKPVEPPKPQEPKVEEPKSASKPEFKNTRMAANLASATVKVGTQLVPAQYIIEKLPIGETFVVSVDSYAAECATDQRGFICLAINAAFQDQYNMLLDDIFESEATYKPQPGDTFAYLNESDEGWYRARCLSTTRCALLDSGKIAALNGNCRRLQQKYIDIPEFCCVLTGNVELNMSLKCTLLMMTPEGFKVSIDSSDDEYLGEGTVTRWLPNVEYAQPSPQAQKIASQPSPKQEKPSPVETKTPQLRQPRLGNEPKPEQRAQPKQDQPIAKQQKQPITKQDNPPITRQDNQRIATHNNQIPEVARPAIVNNGKYFLLHATSLARVCVRPCDAAQEFDSVLSDVVLYGMQKAKPLSEPPQRGDLVLSTFEEAHYRALVKRTKAADNRYMVEYVEYGNEEVVPLEKLSHCPPAYDLTARPALASLVSLSTNTTQLTPPAQQYIDGLKETVELIAMIGDGQKSAPSGSLVQMSIAKNRESINKKLEEMCTPEWKKMEEAGKDVIESKVVLFPDMQTHRLPTDRPFTLDVTDFGNIESGVVCGFEKGTPLAEYIYGPLTEKINEYANSELCREPYLPMVEEICIAKLPPYPQWFRAVVVEHSPGEDTAAVLFIDYGNLEASVPVSHLRKCAPEFCTTPALAATADIKNWPKPATKELLMAALQHLNINEDGRGQLEVTRCKVDEDLTYEIEAPALIAAINAL